MHRFHFACDADDCKKCDLGDGGPDCLILKAHVSMRLTELPIAQALRPELEQFSFELMEEARRLREEQHLVPADSARSQFTDRS